MWRKNWLKFSTLCVYLVILFSIVVALPVYFMDLAPAEYGGLPKGIHKSYGTSSVLYIFKDYGFWYILALFILPNNIIYLRLNKNSWFTCLLPFFAETINIEYSFTYKMKFIAFLFVYGFIAIILITGTVLQFVFIFLKTYPVNSLTIMALVASIFMALTIFLFICILMFDGYQKIALAKRNNNVAA
ncbi:hypothetical protein ACM0LK_03000 [Mycoplasma sp. Z331B]|uniref:hypothetical protein n=1 Tax=unclassified Mycoplasma TaxID=2683645 RepID=UPI003A85669A